MVFLGNQSKLAKFLKINRGTLRKHVNDLNNKNHVIIQQGDKYTFMAVTGGTRINQ